MIKLRSELNDQKATSCQKFQQLLSIGIQLSYSKILNRKDVLNGQMLFINYKRRGIQDKQSQRA